ncbi:MAG: cohesin domain-containing protein [Parcubacteria group bacterium]
MKRIFPLTTIFIVIFSFLLFPRPIHGIEASLYLSPSSGSFLVGSTFTVSIFLNTEGNKINVVWVDLKFPPEILQVTSPIAGTSFIGEWITPPNYSNERGLISFKGGVPEGIITSAGLVSSITFRAVASGSAKIEFTKESKVLLADGKGTDILTKSRDGAYQILIPSPEGPKIFSPTHPDPNIWYSDFNPSFSWERESGVTNFSWSFDQNFQTQPDEISEGKDNSTSFNNVADGIWYFHLRQNKNGIWGKTSHLPVKIDVSPPHNLKIEAETYSGFVYFGAEDFYSKIDHYEVSLIKLNEIPASATFFVETDSPYKIPYDELGKYKLTVRAHDGAGNIKTSELEFQKLSSIISIKENGITIKGFLITWPVIFLSLFLILAVLGYLIFYSLRSKTGFQKGVKEIKEALTEIKKIEERERLFKEKRGQFEKEKGKLEEKLSEDSPKEDEK